MPNKKINISFPKQSFIVKLWSSIFGLLSWISLFNLATKLFPKLISGFFIDLWVLIHLLLSFFSIVLVSNAPNSFFSKALVFYSIIRVFEIVVYQINIMLFDEYRKKLSGREYALRGYRRIVILLFHNLLEIIFWFASVYAFFSGHLFTYNGPAELIRLIGSSFSIMTTFGINEINHISAWGYFFMFYQSCIGIVMTVLSLARFIGLLPTVKSLDETEH